MRNKRKEIIAELVKVDDENVTIDDAFESLDSFTHFELLHDRDMSCYDEVWEHPLIKSENKRNNLINSQYFTLYELKPGIDPSDKRSAFRLVVGRAGNTWIWNID